MKEFETTKTHSVDEARQVMKVHPCWRNDKQVSMIGARGCHKERSKGTESFWKSSKSEAWNRLGQRRSVRSVVSHRWLRATVSS